MITRDNFTSCMKALKDDEKTKIREAFGTDEYAKISISSYGDIWLHELTNDLPIDYDEQIADGTTYFIDVEEIINIIGEVANV